MDEIDRIRDLEDIVKPFWFKKISEPNIKKCITFLDQYYFYHDNLITDEKLDSISDDFIKYQSKNEFNGILKFGILLTIYKLCRIRNRYPTSNLRLEKVLRVREVREQSGVMVFTIFTSAYPSYTKYNEDGTTEIVKEFDPNEPENIGQFTCPKKCSFCPKDPGMPKSYIASEPGVSRAIKNDFDAMKQIISKLFKCDLFIIRCKMLVLVSFVMNI